MNTMRARGVASMWRCKAQMNSPALLGAG